MADTPPTTAFSFELPQAASAGQVLAREHLEAEVVALFDQLRVPLLRYLATLGLPVQDSEEIVQEAFLALFEHLRRGKPHEHLRGWMFRVAHNLGLKRLNRIKSSCPAPEQWMVLDPAPGPEEQAADQQRLKSLTAVIRALPEQDRRCLWLRAQGLRYREIADVLDISLGAVAMSLTRSLARLARVAQR